MCVSSENERERGESIFTVTEREREHDRCFIDRERARERDSHWQRDKIDILNLNMIDERRMRERVRETKRQTDI